jgi:mitogen-activated protein kinase kinase kinase 13
VNLYVAAGLSDDAELLTKQEIVDAIVAARDDVAEIPPSSSRGGTNSSECSSDDGNMAGDEETDIVPRNPIPNGLKRRATATEFCRVNERPLKGRSLSMNYLLAENHSVEVKKAPKFSVIIKGNAEGSGGTTSR